MASLCCVYLLWFYSGKWARWIMSRMKTFLRQQTQVSYMERRDIFSSYNESGGASIIIFFRQVLYDMAVLDLNQGGGEKKDHSFTTVCLTHSQDCHLSLCLSVFCLTLKKKQSLSSFSVVLSTCFSLQLSQDHHWAVSATVSFLFIFVVPQ